MASVNFKKLHNSGEVIAILRHCDKEERKKHNHSNVDINKGLSDTNLQLYRYEEAKARYKSRIEQLDKIPGQNKRKDRVTAFSLEIPCPEGVDVDAWYREVTDMLKRKYKGKNVIGVYLHKDEIHRYVYADHGHVDHGKWKTSRPHIHMVVVPEINGKLNGRQFSSKKAMIEVNEEIDKMTREIYQTPFMTGQKPRKRTVEELKQMSEEEMQKKEEELMLLKKKMYALQDKVTKLYADLQKLTDFEEMRRLYKKVFDEELELEIEKKRQKNLSR